MKFNSLNLLVLGSLVACSTAPKYAGLDPDHKPSLSRYIASVDETISDSAKLQAKVESLTRGIFHSYLLGQVFLQKFDEELEKRPAHAMKSEHYASLLAIRSNVDEFEEQVNELYINLVLVAALPKYTPEQKANAELALKTIGDFMIGVKGNNVELPDALKPLVLSNIREKQYIIYDELAAIHEDTGLTNNDPDVKKVIWEYMAKVRGTRMAYLKQIENYHVSPEDVKAAVDAASKDKSFRDYQKQVKELSKEMKDYIKDVGRETSSGAGITASAGPNGNVTGNGYPANTWSITFDDGPAKTSPQVLQNLKDKGFKATFFQLAKQVESYSNTAKMIWDAGMDIGCHSYDHAQLTKVGPVQLDKEIITATKIIEDKYGKKLKLYRLPYGAGVSVPRIRQKIAALGLVHVFWNVDTLDWQDKNPQSILKRALKQIHGKPKNAGVILFHDIHPQSVIASGLLMDYFNANKTKTCTVQGVIDQLNEVTPDCK